MSKILPSRTDLEELILMCLHAAGGEMNVNEMLLEVAKRANIDIQSRPKIKQSTKRTDIDYKIAWARTSLKKTKKIERVSFGRWRITSLGEESILKK